MAFAKKEGCGTSCLQCRNAGDMGSIPGSGSSPGGGHGSHSNICAWRIPWTEEPGGLQSVESQRVRHDWRDLAQKYKLPCLSCASQLKAPKITRFLVSELGFSGGLVVKNLLAKVGDPG